MILFLYFILLTYINTSRSFVYWNAGKWSECELKNTCFNPGVKTRRVDCRNALRRIIPSKLCDGDVRRKPKQRQECVPRQCYDKLSKSLRIDITSWSNCTVVSLDKWRILRGLNETMKVTKCSRNSNPVAFAKTRNVTCYVQYENNTLVKLDSQVCTDVYKITAREWKLCFYGCLNNCSLSRWSNWKTCRHCRMSNLKYKTRQYTSLPGLFKYKNACPNIIKLKTKKIKLRNQESQYRLFDWDKGKIIIGKKSRKRFLTFTIKRRIISCISNTGKICDAKNSVIPIVEIVVTDKPCVLSDWSPWSLCTSNSSYMQGSMGTQYRKRHIDVLPVGKGKKCDKLISFRNCTKRQDPKYDWFLGDWSSCETTQQARHNCSLSYKTRHVYCFREDDVTKKPTVDYFCTHRAKPSTQRECTLTCQQECRYASWSQWSCDNNTTSRERYEVHKSSQAVCPRIIQRKSRKIFTWKRENPSSCRLTNTSAQCGVGRKTYGVKCTTCSNEVVKHNFCEKKKKPERSESCRVYCPNDCIVDEWSNWGLCKFNYRKRVRHVLARKSGAGMSCPHLTETESCNINEYFWSLSQWSNCQISLTNSTERGTSGIQTRLLRCVKNKIGNFVDVSHCANLVKPNTKKKCELYPTDCKLSLWSDWYPSCKAARSSLPSRDQPFTQRRRYIEVHGNSAGKACSKDLVETKQCPQFAGYRWIIKEWEICTHNTIAGQSFNSQTSLRNGVQKRQVYCSDGFNAVHDGICLGLNKPKLSEYSECQINWMSTCNLMPWGDWSQCTEDCGTGTQERKRIFSSEDCKDKKFDLLQTRTCNTQPCQEYFHHYGAWSECHPIMDDKKCLHWKFINGEQLRNVTCRSSNGSAVANVYCEEYDGEKLRTRNGCGVQCETNCVLSTWSTFSQCSASCGAGMSIRSRRIYAQPSIGGRACPAATHNFVTETKPCKERECYGNVWKAEEWGECIMNRRKKCGRGKRTRTVSCIDPATGETSGNCTDAPPIKERGCKIYCTTDECVVSGWSEWSSCELKDNQLISQRTRRILRAGKERACRRLTDRKICETFSWKANTWSSCLLNSDNETCGAGIRERLIDCVNKNGKAVDPLKCYHINPVAPRMYETCVIPCPGKCEVSPWSEWSACDQKCDTVKYSTRRRVVVSHPKSCGETVLTESLFCPIYPCYTLSVSDWQQCETEHKDTCGVGQQKRSAVCKRSDGKEVSVKYCMEYVTGATRLTRNCQIPCWNDCITTDWSTWSECFGICDYTKKLLMSHGLTVRSRSIIQNSTANGIPCPKTLHEEKKCFSPKCYTQKRRNHQCVRSDGAFLSYGCKVDHSQKKHPCKCPVQNSRCINKRFCRCHHGYVGVTNKSKFLTKCVPLTAKENISADEGEMNITVIIWVVVGSFVVYCVLVSGIIVLYKRHSKTISMKNTFCTNNNNSYYEDVNNCAEKQTLVTFTKKHGRPRQLLASLTEDTDNSSSGISSLTSSQTLLQLDEEELLRYLELNDGTQLHTKL